MRATFASSDTTGYVIFDGHIQLELKPSRPEGEVVLKANPADYLLRKSNEGKYRYRLKIVLSDKNIVEQPSGGGWLESDDDFLHIRFAPTA